MVGDGGEKGEAADADAVGSRGTMWVMWLQPKDYRAALVGAMVDAFRPSAEVPPTRPIVVQQGEPVPPPDEACRDKARELLYRLTSTAQVGAATRCPFAAAAELRGALAWFDLRPEVRR